MNIQISGYTKETNTIEAVQVYVIYKDSKRLLVQDCLGCVYNLDLIDNTCSCGTESLPCPHFAFYYKKIARQNLYVNVCGICYENNKHAETCCFYCKSLFHLDCMQQLSKLSVEACPNCKARWRKTPKICTHCRTLSHPPYYQCLTCNEATVCKKCKDMKIHPNHSLVCSLGGYWSSGMLPFIEVLRRAMDKEAGVCSSCGVEAEELSKMRCNHLIHRNCLERKIYDKNLKCGVCKVHMFLCLETEDDKFNSPVKQNSFPRKYPNTGSNLPQTSLYNIKSNHVISSRYLPSPLLKNRSCTPRSPSNYKLENSKYEL